MQRRTASIAVALAAAASFTGAGISGAATGNATTAAAPTVNLLLKPSSPALEACFPTAEAHVNVTLTTDAIGKDTFKVRAERMKPNTAFTVFLIQKATSPFGGAEYIGDVFTDAAGNVNATFSLIVEEAFAFNNKTGFRADLNSVGMWFADPVDDDGCLGAAGPVTGFDGDASAGVQMLNSGTAKLP